MRKILKISLYTIGSILLLLLCAILYLNSPWGQNFVRGRVEVYLRNKLKTEVRIGHLGYGFPKYVVLDDVLFLDQKRDTLLAVEKLKVDLNMFKLLHKKVDVQKVMMRGMHSHIYRNAPDTTFNYTYIINAFNSGTRKSATADTSGTLSFNLDKIELKDIHTRYDDYSGGIRFVVNLDELNLSMKKTDIDNMFFHVKDLSVSGLNSSFDQDTSYLPPTPRDTTKGYVKIIADNVDLKKVAFRYNNSLNKFLFAMQLGGLQLQLNEYNRDNNRVDVKKLVVNNSDVDLVIGKSTTPPAPVDSIVKIDTTEGWDVLAKDIQLGGVNFKMDNENEPRQPSGIDYSHLDVKGLEMVIQNLTYYDTVAGNLKHFAVKEHCGLDVQELKTVFNYSRKGVMLKDLYLKTPNTVLQNYIEVHYPSVAVMSKSVDLLQLNLNIVNSIVGLKDVALFVPYLQKQPLFNKYKNGHVALEAFVSGYLGDLDIKKLYASGLNNTDILLSGRIRGIPDAKRLAYNLHISKFNSSANDLNAVLPPGTLPGSIRIPDRFGAVGQISGNINDYSGDLAFVSSDGSAHVQGKLLTSPGKGKEEYDVTVKTVQLNIGRILKMDTVMRDVTANFYIKGRGFDTKTMNATADGNILSAFIEGYRYHDISASGEVASQHAHVKLHSVDTNLMIQLNGTADFTGKYPAVVADLNMDSVNLRALKLAPTEFRARGRIHADFTELNPDYPKGTLTWQQQVIVTGGRRYFADSVYVISRPSEDTGQNIYANLGVLDVRITGKTPLTKIGVILQDHINRHYTEAVSDSLKINLANLTKKKNGSITGGVKTASKPVVKKDTTIPADYNLNLLAHIYNKPVLQGLVPGLTSFDSIHVDGSLTPRNMTLNVRAPEIVYYGVTIENSNIQLRGSDSALTYRVNVDQLNYGNYALYYADVHGGFDNNIFTTDVSLSDAGKKERFALKGSMETKGDSQIVRLSPGLKLNYDVWQVDGANRTVLSSKGIYVSNFAIDNAGQSIRINSSEPRPNAPIRADISNFKLANITDIVSKNDTLPANGLLNGNITIDQVSPVLKMTGNVQVQDLSVYGDTLGNMTAQVNNKTDDQLDTKITLQGHGNDVSITGIYYLKPSGNNVMDLDLKMSPLAVRTIEGMTQHQIRNTSGFVRGNLKIQGSLSNPNITGELTTDNLKTTVTAVNTDFRMPAEHIGFNNSQVALNNFTVLDSNGNRAQINGTMDISDLMDPGFDLKISANNWHAIHSTAKQNKEMYGDLILTTNLNVTGSATVPSVEGNIYVLKGTKLTVTNPTKDPGIQSAKGIVVFVNMRDSSWGKALMPRTADTMKTRKRLAPGSDINVNVSVDKNAEFSLVIDEASGDFISVRGEAYLNTSVSPGGVLELTGNYLLNSGVYQMNYNFIRRRFLIQDGSTITFAGDPMKNTLLDVTAKYQANTPAYDLISRQVSDPAQLIYYRQSLPFDIDLHMKGNMMTPAFTFDVVLPDNKVYPLTADQIELIQAKLAQIRMDTSELNKQVFAVLILGRFVSDDPFSSGTAQGVGFAAVQSVSTFIGEQLNRAAGKLVKGVDLTVDLATKEDYTTGAMRQRTDLSVAASKRLLNDRLKLTVGNDFEVEGPQTNSNNNQGNYLPSNLAADYMLSSDGRYTVQVYRKNYDEGVLQGYVTETGLNFIVNVDYNRFKTIFKRRPRNRSVPAVSDTVKIVTGPIK